MHNINIIIFVVLFSGEYTRWMRLIRLVFSAEADSEECGAFFVVFLWLEEVVDSFELIWLRARGQSAPSASYLGAPVFGNVFYYYSKWQIYAKSGHSPTFCAASEKPFSYTLIVVSDSIKNGKKKVSCNICYSSLLLCGLSWCYLQRYILFFLFSLLLYYCPPWASTKGDKIKFEIHRYRVQCRRCVPTFGA